MYDDKHSQDISNFYYLAILLEMSSLWCSHVSGPECTKHLNGHIYRLKSDVPVNSIRVRDKLLGLVRRKLNISDGRGKVFYYYKHTQLQSSKFEIPKLLQLASKSLDRVK